MLTSGYSHGALGVLTGYKLDDEDELSAALSLGESVRAYESCGGNSAYSHGVLLVLTWGTPGTHMRYSGYSHGIL